MDASKLAYHDFIVSKYRPSVLVPNLRAGLPSSGSRVQSWGANQSRRFADGAAITAQRLYGEAGSPPGAGMIAPVSDRTGACSVVVRMPSDMSSSASIFGWAYMGDGYGSFVQVTNVDESGAASAGFGVGRGTGATSNSGSFEGFGNRPLLLAEAVAWLNDATSSWGTGWASFGATISGASAVIYKNGAAISSRTMPGSVVTTGAQYVCVGGYNVTGGSFNRRTDAPVIWACVWSNRVLTAAEYLDLHLAGLDPAMHRVLP